MGFILAGFLALALLVGAIWFATYELKRKNEIGRAHV